MLSPIKSLFAKCNLDIILYRLAILDQRLAYINQEYNWAKWSDFGFLDYVCQAFWLTSPANLSAPTQLLSADWDEKLRFLEGLKTIIEDAEHNTFRKLLLSLKKRGMIWWGVGRRVHDIERDMRISRQSGRGKGGSQVSR
jgi:hypothetical protein